LRRPEIGCARKGTKWCRHGDLRGGLADRRAGPSSKDDPRTSIAGWSNPGVAGATVAHVAGPRRTAHRRFRRCRLVERQLHAEGASLSELALDADLGAEEIGEPAADRKAETGATGPPGDRPLHLPERLENPAHVLVP